MLKVPYNIRPRGYENQTRVMPYRMQESYIKQTLCDISTIQSKPPRIQVQNTEQIPEDTSIHKANLLI